MFAAKLKICFIYNQCIKLKNIIGAETQVSLRLITNFEYLKHLKVRFCLIFCIPLAPLLTKANRSVHPCATPAL